MIKRSYKIVLVVVMLIVMATGCGIFKGGQKGCGCPSKKGMVGY
jgi:hypothetical protein